MCKYRLWKTAWELHIQIVIFQEEQNQTELTTTIKSIYSLTCTDTFMSKPDEDHALPSKKTLIISGCPVTLQGVFPTLSSWTFLSLPYLPQYLECLSLCKAPQGDGLRFPPEQWGVTLLSVPCRRGICFCLWHCWPSYYNLKPPQVLRSPRSSDHGRLAGVSEYIFLVWWGFLEVLWVWVFFFAFSFSWICSLQSLLGHPESPCASKMIWFFLCLTIFFQWCFQAFIYLLTYSNIVKVFIINLKK